MKAGNQFEKVLEVKRMWSGKVLDWYSVENSKIDNKHMQMNSAIGLVNIMHSRMTNKIL